MRFCSIASGSSGNCIYIGSDNTHILIDSGISGKKIEEGLNSLGVKPGELDAILVTHEHVDHIGGLGVMSRRYGIPVYSSSGTIEALKSSTTIGKIDSSLFHEVDKEINFSIGDISILPFKISHDAADPVAYRFDVKGVQAAVCTDLGNFDANIVEKLSDLDYLLLEANHDVKMLECGPYPYPLKQRILSDRGHLSNELSGQLLNSILSPRLKAVSLGHLSRENNYPDLALEAVRIEIDFSGIHRSKDYYITVAKRDSLSQIFDA